MSSPSPPGERWRSRLSCNGSRAQTGATLVETLVAIAILSILLLGIMAALSSTATMSRTTGQAARTRVALATVADRIATMKYPGCTTAAELTTTIRTSIVVPADYTVTVTKLDNLLPKSASCTSSTSVLLLAVRVDHDGSHTGLSGEVVLRDRDARPT